MAYTTIDDPEAYFQVKTYTGNGSDDHAITFDGTTNMSPNMVWIKDRERSGYNHCLIDSVRGVTKVIRPNLSNVEATISDALKSFDSDGFTLDDDAGNGEMNINTETYVAWCWKESVTAGFDIVSYTGNGSNRTISHSLSEEPHWMLFKSRSDAYSWVSYTKTYGNNSVLALNSTGANDSGVGSSYFNSTNPTSSVFSLGTAANMNGSSKTFIAYLFAPKQGFSKFSRYYGNGNASGTTVFCGFTPAFVLIKSTASGVWRMWDNKRDRLNPNTANFQASASDAEYDDASVSIDFLSSGFKLRATDSSFNGNGTAYVYAAFAEAPFVNSNGVPCNAR